MEEKKAPGRLEGKKALITGANRGIGLAVAGQFAREGADLYLCSRDMEKLEKAKAALAAAGRDVQIQSTDVSDRQAVGKLVENALSHMGGIDILVNNAGVYKPKPFLDYSPEEFDRVMKINLYGLFNMMQFVLKHMMEKKRGKIVNVASTAGKWASPNQSAYNASKHAVVGLTRCVALETANCGITVNAICPGVVETDLLDLFFKGHAEILGVDEDAVQDALLSRIPMKRWLDPIEVAHLAVYLASGESDGMTGQSILLDAGMLFV